MPTRSNALSELTRFWLELRHGCCVRESVPVVVPGGNSDIDFLAICPNLKPFELRPGTKIGPRLIVESKDEHDADPHGTAFGKNLVGDLAVVSDAGFIPANTPNVKFVMLKEQHFEKAKEFFGTADFDRLFVTHDMKPTVSEQDSKMMNRHRIHWLTAQKLLDDLASWYAHLKRPTQLRNALMGDVWHLVFGYWKARLPDEIGR